MYFLINLIFFLFSITRNFFLFFYDVTLRIKFLPTTIKKTAENRAIIRKLHSFTESVIRERKNKFQQNKVDDKIIDEFGTKKKTAFLDLLLQSKIDGQPLSENDIREEVDTFMFEGHDTTTSGIAFLLLNLAKYPKIQNEVYEECKLVLGDKQNITMQDLNKLSFMEKVIKESLRIHPPVKSQNFPIKIILHSSL